MKTLLIISSIFVMIGCKTTDSTDDSTSNNGIPDCITQKINAIKAMEVKKPPLSVWQFQYNGRTVYYISPYCCDMFSELYDNQCNLICNPDGGFTGRGDGKCPDFAEKKTDEKLIWKDNRTYPHIR